MLVCLFVFHRTSINSGQCILSSVYSKQTTKRQNITGNTIIYSKVVNPESELKIGCVFCCFSF